MAGAILQWCASGAVRHAHAALRRIRASAKIPEHTSAMAVVKDSQVLLPVSGSGRADAEGLAVSLAEALALALAEVLALALAEAG